MGSIEAFVYQIVVAQVDDPNEAHENGSGLRRSPPTWNQSMAARRRGTRARRIHS